MIVFHEHTEQDAGVRCCSIVPYERSDPSLYRQNDAFLHQIPEHTPPRNRCRCGNDGTTPVSMPIAADRFRRCGRPPLRQQFVLSFGISLSTAIVYCSDDRQTTTLRPTPRHRPALPEAASLLCWAKERLFFYPRCQGMTRDSRCAFYTPHTASFLVHTKDLFLSLRTVCSIFRLQNTAGAAVITQVLLIAVAIMSIQGNILAAALTAAVSSDFGYHRLWSKKLVQNIFPKFTQNHVFLYHYQRKFSRSRKSGSLLIVRL